MKKILVAAAAALSIICQMVGTEIQQPTTEATTRSAYAIAQDLAQRQPIDLQGLSNVQRAAFSPDGKHLVVIDDNDNSPKILDVSTGKVFRVLKGHADRVITAHF